MIILDEQLKDRHLITAVERWYHGAVTHIQTLRPNTVVKDDNIASLLLTVSTPTFVTINVDDFWHKAPIHSDYCIIVIDLSQGEVDELPALLRRVLNSVHLKTKALRMGKIVRVQGNRIRYYDHTRQLFDLEIE